jgi:hypothetical protein
LPKLQTVILVVADVTVLCCAVLWLFVRLCVVLVLCVQGVLYTHRSNYLHALITVAPDMLALGAGETRLTGRQGSSAGMHKCLSICICCIHCVLWCCAFFARFL